ncbi:MAG: translocation/assembly module TamB domain-containing protein [Rhodocyclaceae bacterium]|nr:translocation/assembly module TamB domain-containing protein [Rhodocyclaceae bacterium]
MAAAVAALALLALALATAMIATDWGARLAWQTATRLTHGRLSGELVGGTLSRGLRLDDVRFRDDTLSIRIDRVETRWRWSLAPLALDVEWLRIGMFELTPGAKRPAPPALPERLTLPLRVAVRRATVDDIVILGAGGATHLRDIALQASSDGRRHRLSLEHAATPLGTATAALTLDGQRPFALDGKASLRGQFAERRFLADAEFSGTLETFGIRIDAAADALKGNAAVDATPFSALPFRRLQVALDHLDPHAWRADWPRADARLQASLVPSGSGDSFAVAGPVALANGRPGALGKGLLPLVFARADVVLAAQRLRLSALRVRLTGAAAVNGSGEIVEHAGQADYAFAGSIAHFDPAPFLPRLAGKKAARTVSADISGDLEASGSLHPLPSATVRFAVRDSRYGAWPMSGAGVVSVEGRRLRQSDARLEVAGNRASIAGSFGAPSDVLHVDLDAPALDRLGFGLSGAAKLNGKLGGSLVRPTIDASYRAERLAYGAVRIGALAGEAHVHGWPGGAERAQERLAIHVAARDAQGGGLAFSRIDAAADGSFAAHTLRIDAAADVRGKPLSLHLAAAGGLHEQAQGLAWDGVLRTLESRGLLPVSLASPLTLAVAPAALDVGAGRLTAGHAVLDLEALHWDEHLIRSEGRIAGLDLGELLAWRQRLTGARAGIDTDLVLDADWNITLGAAASGFVEVVRRGGDVALPGDGKLGLQRLSLRAELEPEQIRLDAEADARRIGTARGQVRMAWLHAGERLAIGGDSALSGKIAAALPRLQQLAALAGPRIALEGGAALDVALGGTLGHPALSGSATADGLALTLYDQGVRLHDGSARLRMDGDVIELQRLEFHGAAGTLRAAGRLPLDMKNGVLSASIVADQLQLLSGPAQQLTVTGRADAANPGGDLRIDGRFVVDHARFTAPPKPAPKLGDDVIIVRDGQATAAPADPLARRRAAGPFAPRLNVDVDLGDDFIFEGSGANLRLAGDLKLRSDPGEAPQVFGTVRVAKGSYEAFGTQLDIERGLITFHGPANNPSLNILAMRRNQDVPAGVQVTGSVTRPEVEVVSEPSLPKDEQISWLVFGHGTSSASGQASAQKAVSSAALGLLGKVGGAPLAKAFGLSTLSLGESTAGLEGVPVVSLGKSISDRLSVGYEQSLAGAQGVLMLTYDLARSWSVVARGGSVAGLELLYSKRFDSLRQP